MFNRKSSYALNKKDPNAIVYMDANEAIIRLTREDFASEEEFLKWKSWSDGNYHTEDNQDVVEGKHNTSIDDLSEAALSTRMIVTAKIEKLENGKLVLKPDVDISRFLAQKRPRRVEVRLDDGRTISADQRRKIFAIIRDISLWSGQEPEELRLYLE